MTEPCTVPANSRKALKGLRQQQVTWEDRELCCHGARGLPKKLWGTKQVWGVSVSAFSVCARHHSAYQQSQLLSPPV